LDQTRILCISWQCTIVYRPYIFDRGENKFEKYFFLRKEQCSWLRCFLFSFCSCSQFQKFFMFLFCSCSRTRTSSRTCSRTTCVFFHPWSTIVFFIDNHFFSSANLSSSRIDLKLNYNCITRFKLINKASQVIFRIFEIDP